MQQFDTDVAAVRQHARCQRFDILTTLEFAQEKQTSRVSQPEVVARRKEIRLEISLTIRFFNNDKDSTSLCCF